MTINRTQMDDRAALPGDPDLDCDIEDIVVTAVVAVGDDQEILIRLQGGHGRWASADTGEIVEVDHVNSVDVHARFGHMPEHMWRQVINQVVRGCSRQGVHPAPGLGPLPVPTPQRGRDADMSTDAKHTHAGREN